MKTFDFDRIIMESISEMSSAPVAKPDEVDKVLTEGTSSPEASPSEQVSENIYEGMEHVTEAIIPAISAGLGALQLRNRVRSIS